MSKLDESFLEVLNQSNVTQYIYRQFINCRNCPLIRAFAIEPGQNATFTLKSYFDQFVVLSQTNNTFWFERATESNDTTPSCYVKNLLYLRDKSRHQLLIDSDHNCQWTRLQSGQNQWLFASAVLLVYAISIVTIIYGYKLLKQYWNARRIEQRSPESPTFSNQDSFPAIRPSRRFGSIDCLRGMTIMLMIFVNYGAGQYKYLQHVPWDGLHLADIVFPFFIFVMGLSIAISFKNVVTINDNKYKIIKRIIKRSINLFLLGIMVNSIGAADIKTIRIPGVLQRFSLSYGIVAIVQLVTVNMITSSSMPRCLNCIKLWPQYALALTMILIHTYFTFLWKFDDQCPVGYVGPGGLSDNMSYPHCVGGAAHKIDQLIFTPSHCYRNNFGGILYDQGFFRLWHDPEGLLGVTTSVVLTIIGLQAGHFVMHNVQPWARFRKLINLIVMLAISTIVLVLVFNVPINKNLWSLSFVTINGCLATLVFSICHYLIDIRKIWPNGVPFNYPGQNSIMLYLGHEIANDMLPFKLANYYSSHWGYLAQNILATMVWFVISYWMAVNEIFIKV